MINALFSRKWIFASLVVVLATGVLARLGVWQLDRLEARRAFNARVIEQQSASEIILDKNSISQNLSTMEYRQVSVRGKYLPADEIILRNQIFEGRVGYQLFTPLMIEGSDHAVYVQRGWIPEEFALPAERSIYSKEGINHVEGIIRRAETDFGIALIPDPTLAAMEDRLDAWNNLDLSRIGDQMEIPILNIYIQMLPGENNLEAPFPLEFALDLTEGSHLGYAGQWFIFALLLGIGYPIYVSKHTQNTGVK